MNILLFIILILFSYMMLHIILPLLRIHFLDVPNERSSHLNSKPSGGGMVFVFITCIGSFFTGDILPLICLPLSLVGLLDDYLKLNSLIRYFVQILTAIILVYLTNFSDIFNIQGLFYIWYLITIILVTAVINMFNFMDGVDGLLASCMLLAFSCLAYVHSLSLYFLLGSLIGFLFLNWDPSKIFMGDVGSTFLGALFAGFVLKSNNLSDAIWIISLSFPLLFDASICIFRRFMLGLNIFKPHHLHLYQRLNQSGWSHRKVTLTYLAFTSLFCISFFLNYFPLLVFNVILILSLGAFLDMYIAVPFHISLSKRN